MTRVQPCCDVNRPYPQQPAPLPLPPPRPLPPPLPRPRPRPSQLLLRQTRAPSKGPTDCQRPLGQAPSCSGRPLGSTSPPRTTPASAFATCGRWKCGAPLRAPRTRLSLAPAPRRPRCLPPPLRPPPPLQLAARGTAAGRRPSPPHLPHLQGPPRQMTCRARLPRPSSRRRGWRRVLTSGTQQGLLRRGPGRCATGATQHPPAPRRLEAVRRRLAASQQQSCACPCGTCKCVAKVWGIYLSSAYCAMKHPRLKSCK